MISIALEAMIVLLTAHLGEVSVVIDVVMVAALVHAVSAWD